MAIDWDKLFEQATEARRYAHAPYSRYRVGAAVLTASGRSFAGCNVENATYGLTVCAERTAIVQMVAAGETTPVALAIVTPGPPPAMPCGLCRQTLVEFARDLPIRVAVAQSSAPPTETTLAELLPRAFGPETLGRGRDPSG